MFKFCILCLYNVSSLSSYVTSFPLSSAIFLVQVPTDYFLLFYLIIWKTDTQSVHVLLTTDWVTPLKCPQQPAAGASIQVSLVGGRYPVH